MNCPVMDAAQGGNEFVAHLPAECTRLHKAQVVGIGRFSPAHETRLLGDEPEMLFVAIATRLGNRQHALVDSPGRISSLGIRHSLLGGGPLVAATPETVGVSPGSACKNSDNLSSNAFSTSLASAAVRLFLAMIPSRAQLAALSGDRRPETSTKKSIPQRG